MPSPLVSVAFPCFQQQEYVEEALLSVLAQTWSPLEVIISDDASTDSTYEIVREVVSQYDGPHTIRLNQNPQRMGIENYNRLMEMSSGELIVIAHSDDASEANRVERLAKVWLQEQVSLVSSNAMNIDSGGNELGLLLPRPGDIDTSLEFICDKGRSPGTHGATLAWVRDVFNRFGPLKRQRTAVCSDYILPFRAALLRGIRFVPEPLVRRRVNDDGRYIKYIGHQVSDSVAHKESKLANHLTQLVYMLETLQEKGLETGRKEQELNRMQQILQTNISETAKRWATERNSLVADGKQINWSTPEGKNTAPARVQIKRTLRRIEQRLRRNFQKKETD